MHQRTVFINEVLTAFKLIPSVEERVFINRTRPTQKESLPSIEVFYDTEDHSEFSKSPVEWTRSLTLMIEMKADGSDDLKMTENIDDLTDQVEQIMIEQDESDCAFGGVDKIQWTGFVFEFDGSGELPIGVAKFNVVFEYNTKRKTEPTLDDLKKVNTEWNIDKKNDNDPPDPANRPLTEAEDCIENLDV